MVIQGLFNGCLTVLWMLLKDWLMADLMVVIKAGRKDVNVGKKMD